MKFKKDMVVRATMQIVEGPVGVGDPQAIFPNDGYIYAEPGDIGIVEFEDTTDDGGDYPTVRFTKTGIATSVFEKEIEVIQ